MVSQEMSTQFSDINTSSCFVFRNLIKGWLNLQNSADFKVILIHHHFLFTAFKFYFVCSLLANLSGATMYMRVICSFG